MSDALLTDHATRLGEMLRAAVCVADRAVLASCDLVIHSAATVAFDSPLDAAVEERDAAMRDKAALRDQRDAAVASALAGPAETGLMRALSKAGETLWVRRNYETFVGLIARTDLINHLSLNR